MSAECRLPNAECRKWCTRSASAQVRLYACACVVALLSAGFFVGSALCGESEQRLRGALVTADMVTDQRLETLRRDYSAIVLALNRGEETARVADKQAAKKIAESGLELHYWIEVGRCEELAEAHPRWMASLQGHPEWRRFYKDFPQPKPDEVVKCYPWVPVSYQEAHDAHLGRIKNLLADLPPAKSVFLNDLQAAPSACGCGNPVCRWTTDYGPIVTATRLGDDAAAKFVAAVRKLVPAETAVVPVWTTECEEHDKENDALCAGVGCYKGTCWKEYTKQLMPVADDSPTLAVLLAYKEFGQDGPHYKQKAGWIRHALVHGFDEQPAKNKGRKIEPSRLIAVLQGWNVTNVEIAAQIDQAKSAGAAGYIVAVAKIDQSWSPKMVKWK
jgi:hypothetical protein